MPELLSYSPVNNSSAIPRAVIFDFDGTLLDTFPAIVAAFNAALAPISGRTYSDADVIAHFGPPDEGMIVNALKEFPNASYDQAIARYFAMFEEADKSCPIFDGIPELLDDLASRQIPLGIMTGKGRRAAEITLHRLQWHSRFGTIITGDDAAPKPAPDGPLLAARELNVAPNGCVFVGDSPADIQAATAAGMTAVVAGWHGFFREDLREIEMGFLGEHAAGVKRLVALFALRANKFAARKRCRPAPTRRDSNNDERFFVALISSCRRRPTSFSGCEFIRTEREGKFT